jgi:hypothetical protein
MTRSVVAIGRTSQAVILGLLVAACGSESSTPVDTLTDAPVVDSAPDALPMPELQTPSTSKPLGAWYSFYLRPIPGDGNAVLVQLVVTFVEPSFTCSGTAPTGLDAMSFGFTDWFQGARSQMVIARSGPILGMATGGLGEVRLSVDDDRYLGVVDGGADVMAGGHLEGQVDYAFDGGISVRGRFFAEYCAQLDFVQ